MTLLIGHATKAVGGRDPLLLYFLLLYSRIFQPRRKISSEKNRFNASLVGVLLNYVAFGNSRLCALLCLDFEVWASLWSFFCCKLTLKIIFETLFSWGNSWKTRDFIGRNFSLLLINCFSQGFDFFVKINCPGTVFAKRIRKQLDIAKCSVCYDF